MAYRYKITPLAVADMDEALDYLTGKLQNSQAAESLYRAIRKEISSICNYPYAFPNCRCYLIDDDNIRHAVVGNYILVYKVSPTEGVVSILRFLYGGRDISSMKLGQ